VAVVAGVGPGLGAALCRRLVAEGYAVAALARSTDFIDPLAETVAREGGVLLPLACDTALELAVDEAFDRIEQRLGRPRVLVYNAGRLIRGGLLEVTPKEFTEAWRVNCSGAYLCARRSAPPMLEHGGAMIFTGATASVKAAGGFAAFGASKFGLRGLAQSLSRELGPKGVHVAHVIIDGIIWTPRTQAWPGVTEDKCLRPESIAEAYLGLIRQDRSAWTFELDLRPDVEAH
jgi:NAD(P)-dependent dehydrogenase (short-subunit alcohol dehydrogenase family)